MLDYRKAVAFFCAAALEAFAVPPALSPQAFVSGLSNPVEIVHAGDSSGRLFVLEAPGRVRVIRNGVLQGTPFLDLTPANGGPVLSGGEQGLLGIAFHPSYAANGQFYVFYNRVRAGDPGGSDIVVERYTCCLGGNPDIANPSSGSVVIVVPHPQQGNHNGGKLAFGSDGYLYVALGDGGGGGDPFEAGQSLSDLRGKILRLDVNTPPYAIPPTNPFANASPPVRREIWAYGLRNPWRFSFDRLTGDLFIADVGQNLWEEVNFEPRGAGGRNYGWDVFEATHCFEPSSGCSLAGHTPPVLEYPHDGTGGFSVTGGYRYRGGALPALEGYYVYGDFVSGRIWAASPDGNGIWTTTQVGSLSNLSTFGEDENGELYAANFSAGTVMRLTPAATTIPRLAAISTRTQVLTGDDVMIGGFVVDGIGNKKVVVRARGPSLAAAGVANVLADPRFDVVRSSDQAMVGGNDNWQDAFGSGLLQASGYAPSDPAEAALMMTLSPGAYTVIVSGVNGSTGVGLVEVFELDHPEISLAAISTRGRVLTGDQVMIGGFIIQGNAPQTVIVRGRGPSLAAAGIANPLANPMLTLVRSSDGATIAINDNWQEATNAAQVQASGFAPTDPAESAILITLVPGAYTAVLGGVSNGTGVGIVEVFAQ